MDNRSEVEHQSNRIEDQPSLLADKPKHNSVRTFDNEGFQDTQVIIRLFDKENLGSLVWPTSDAGQFARRYLTPFIIKGSKYFIENSNVEMKILQVDNHILPIVIVNDNYENSYVCSPYGHYVTLALDKSFLFKNSFIRKAVTTFLKAFGTILQSGRINRVVYVDHWMLSTDLHPYNISKRQLDKITEFLKEQFPNNAIAFRSLNSKNSSQLKKDLQKNGYKFIVSRQIYITDTSENSLFNTRIIKSDLKFWRECGYDVIDGAKLTQEEKKHILNLYNIHSIVNHSPLNPQFNSHFLDLMLDQNLLHIKALKKDGTIEGVAGYQIKNGVFFCPFFGYDKTQQEQPRIYRLLSTMLLLEAKKEGKLFHQSAGASFYKKIRRALSYTEYLGVYTRHLPFKQRFTWSLLRLVMNTIAVPVMKNY